MTLSHIEIHQKLEELEIKFNEVEQTNKILSRQIKELFLLYDACKKLNQTRNHKEVFSVLTSILKKDFFINEFSVFIYNVKLKILNIQFSNGLPKRNIKEFFYRSHEGFVGKVFNSSQPLYIKDLSVYKNFNYYQMDKRFSGSIFYLPLSIPPAETFGVLKLRKPIPDSFTEIEQSILKQLSEPLSIAIKRGIIFDKVDRYAWIDELTGLSTKKYFEKQFNSEIRRSQRYQHSLSLINLTVDNFPEIVHEHGKENGDLVLKEFAFFLIENMRMSDICFRYASSQFLMLLPETQKDAAQKVVQKIQRNWENKEILLYNEIPVSIEISAGFANYPKDTIEPPVLLKIALESVEKF
jgi:diguanylate cyclase (GGDEF)-like protein